MSKSRIGNSGISNQARCKIKKRCLSKPNNMHTKQLSMKSNASDLNSMPLNQLKNIYTSLNTAPNKELSYKNSTKKSKRGGSAASLESRKETINLIVNKPNTALQILLKESSPQIVGSPSIFPTSNQHAVPTFASRFTRDPPQIGSSLNTISSTDLQ